MVSAGGTVVEIASSDLKASFRPDLGGRMTRLVLAPSADIVRPLQQDQFDPLMWPKAGAYPLIPYHNRIEGGRLAVIDGVVNLRPHPLAPPHSLHGPAHRRPWSVGASSPSSVTMHLDYEPDEDWPWAFEASQSYAVTDRTLSIQLAIWNRDRMEMPAGLGWHPYFTGSALPEHDALYRWPHRSDFLPVGHRVSIDAPFPERLSSTAYLQDWRKVRLPIAGAGVIAVTASPALEHLVLHQAKDYTCIEAVSHVANGFNLAERGVQGTGMRWLTTGESFTGSIVLAVGDGE